MLERLNELWLSTGLAAGGDVWRNYLMLLVSFVLFYLAIKRQFEPLLLVPIAFGMFLVNIPGGHDLLYVPEFAGKLDGGSLSNLREGADLTNGGLFDYLSLGITLGIFPPIIFLGIGAMTDFEPLLGNPKSMLLGAGAQLGIFITFFGAIFCGRYILFPDAAGNLNMEDVFKMASSVAIIGGADGPTAIYVTTKLYAELLPIIAIAAYSYMALIPVIQPFIMKGLTTRKERLIRMTALRKVSQTEKVIFPIAVTLIVCILLPAALPLIGMFMLGNLLNVCKVTERLAKTAA
ncbi:MAG: sodium ion-translocating decarboxylase subunit beta, partial [Clostridiales bacterium]|nr:sodium ion-translocating decarboxylase subunit beta [Clostridiales bacterium]